MTYRLIAASAAILVAGGIGATVATRPRPGAEAQARFVVRLALTADGHAIATLATPSGTMATMAVEGGEVIGLTPEAANDRVVLNVALKDEVTGQFITVGRYTLQRNQPTSVGTERTRLEVEWLETMDVSGASAAAAMSKGPCTNCCIVCEGRTICACEVITSCGYCCCPTHCYCSEGSPRRSRS